MIDDIGDGRLTVGHLRKSYLLYLLTYIVKRATSDIFLLTFEPSKTQISNLKISKVPVFDT